MNVVMSSNTYVVECFCAKNHIGKGKTLCVCSKKISFLFGLIFLIFWKNKEELK